MFAGIGYFTIPIAVHSNVKKIYAIEINPVSYNFLCENIKLNKVETFEERENKSDYQTGRCLLCRLKTGGWF